MSTPTKARHRNARFCSAWPRRFRTPCGDGSSERTWQVFWKIAVLGQSVREASEAAGISYYAAFAAQKRVGRMLREEGQRLLAERRVLIQSRTDRRLIEPSDCRRGVPMSPCPSPETLGRLACDSVERFAVRGDGSPRRDVPRLSGRPGTVGR